MSQTIHRINHRLGIGKISYLCAEGLGPFGSTTQKIGRDDLYPLQAQQAGEDQSNRPLPCYQHRVPFHQPEHLHGFQHGINRFQHGPLHCGVAARNPH